MTTAIHQGNPDAGIPHVWFYEEEVASAKQRRGSLLHNMRVLTVIGVALTVILSAAAAESTYVAPSGSATAPYDSWEKAAHDLATAAAATDAGGTVRIAPGTYAVSETVVLDKALTVRSADPETDAVAPSTTILDGGSACGIVSVRAAVSFVGLTFSHGSATGNGGALCVTAYAGGGGCENCIFSGNVASVNGGAVYIEASANNTPFPMTSCTLAGNYAGTAGGGVHAAKGIALTDCVFRGNLAGSGSDYAEGTQLNAGWATISGCDFDSTVVEGCTTGGSHAYVIMLPSGHHSVSDTVFRNSQSISRTYLNFGGSGADGDTVFLNVTITNMNCRYLMQNRYGSSILKQRVLFRNVRITNNSWNYYLGYCKGYPWVIDNCTVAKNSTGANRASLIDASNFTCNFNNTIVWDNTGSGTVKLCNMTTVVSNSCVQCETSGASDFNVLSKDPLFTAAAAGDYSLDLSSPCIDQGAILDWQDAETLDLAGNLRVLRKTHSLSEDPKAVPDMGAYESTGMPIPQVAYVVPADTAGNTPLSPYDTWETAANDVGKAIAAVALGGTVKVAPGTYAVSETIVTDRSMTLVPVDPATEAYAPGGAIFDAAGSCCIVSNSAAVTFRGLTFQNGRGQDGGAIYNSDAGMTCRDCVFIANVAANRGGAVFGATACSFAGCIFRGNVAAKNGMHYTGYTLVAADCVFDGTGVTTTGDSVLDLLGGNGHSLSNCVVSNHRKKLTNLLSIDNSEPGSALVQNLTVTNNSCNYVINSHYGNNKYTNRLNIFRNVLIADNDIGKCLTYVCTYPTTFDHLTVTDNRISDGYFASVSSRDFTVTVRNSILWGNGTTASLSDKSWLLATYSDSDIDVAVDGGTRVINKNPRFVTGYSLRASSPCVDQGAILDWQDATSVDLAGNPRIVKAGKPLAEDPSALPDMGCYECLLSKQGICILVR